MKVILRKTDLVELLSDFDCSGLVLELKRKLDFCENTIVSFTHTQSEEYTHSYTKADLIWLSDLINALPSQNHKNRIPLFFSKYKTIHPRSVLTRIGFTLCEAIKITNIVKTLQNTRLSDLSTNKLEDIALTCNLISKCRTCVHGHYTSDHEHKSIGFMGCLIAGAVSQPVQGDCNQYMRREHDNG